MSDEINEVPELNADGLVPGQPVSFEQIKAAEHARRQKPAEDAATSEVNIPESPADIDKLKKDELVELLKANGVDDPRGNVPDLKADLKKIMFADL